MKIKDLIKEWYKHNETFFENIKIRRILSQDGSQDFTKLYKETHQSAEPIFVLSTGRCGTALLTNVLQSNTDTKVVHHPYPEPTWHANWAYHNQISNPDSVMAVADALRYEVIRNTFVSKLKYIETSNRITFFAHALAELYPSSKFIHIYRDAKKFVRSGINRNWYSTKLVTDEGRLYPETLLEEWATYSQAEKVGWLWQTTNAYIEEFKSTIDSERVLTISSESLFKNTDIWNKISEFVDIEIPKVTIRKNLRTPTNKQSKFSDRNLSDVEIKSIEALTPLMKQYY